MRTWITTSSPFFREEEQLKAILEGVMSTKSPFFRENEHIYKDILNRNVMDKEEKPTKIDIHWCTSYNKKEKSTMLNMQILFTQIQKVIYNKPATIVFWNDGTKTVVKCCKDDTYDPEKGLLMAIVKKSFRDSNDFHKELKKWTIHTASQELSYKNNCMVTIERGDK